MIKRFPLPPIQLAYLSLLAYFTVYRFHWALVGIILFSFWRLWKNGRAIFLRTLLILSVLTGVFAYRHHQAERADTTAPAQLTSLALIPDSLQINGDQLSFRGQSDGRVYQVFYQLKTQTEQEFFKTSTHPVRLTGSFELSEAEGQRNFKGFDYHSYLETQGIYQVAKVTSLEEVSQRSLSGLGDYLHLLRRQALVYIYSHFPEPMTHYMTGLLFGHLDKSFDDMTELYSSLGIIHLFALSGMQVDFFLGWFRKIFLRLGLTVHQVDGLQVPLSFCYAVLTGFQVSVCRSLLQSFWSRLGVTGMDNLGLTVLSLLVLVPNSLLTTGGVLSCTYAFVLCLLTVDEFTGLKRQVVEALALALAVLPVLMFYFSSFQPLSLLLTALLSLLFDGVMLPVLSLAFLLSPLVNLGFLNGLFILLEHFLGLVGQGASRSLVLGSPSVFILLCLLLCLGLLYDYRNHKKVVVSLSLVLALLFFLTKHPLENEVTVVDIGQGDSIFLRDVSGKTLLIDVGGRVEFDAGEEWQQRQTTSNASRTLIPYLKSRGVGRIDQLVLTHTDTDHIGDMEEVAKEFTIGEVLVSQGSLTDADFVKRLRAMNVRVRTVTAGDRLPFMGSHLQVLYPWTTGDGGNNDSLVLYGRLLGLNFLFTGDLEAGELELIKHYPDLPVDVLKAGHHGSKGSSYPEFLEHTKPKVALVSAGQNNRYKHPHQETLERFEQQRIKVYRTDTQGAIRFRGLFNWQIETVR